MRFVGTLLTNNWTLCGQQLVLAAAGPVNITTTNIPGAMIIPFANDALAAGAVDRWREDFTFPIATSAQATATTIIAPVQTGVIWRITVGYYVAP